MASDVEEENEKDENVDANDATETDVGSNI